MGVTSSGVAMAASSMTFFQTSKAPGLKMVSCAFESVLSYNVMSFYVMFYVICYVMLS